MLRSLLRWSTEAGGAMVGTRKPSARTPVSKLEPMCRARIMNYVHRTAKEKKENYFETRKASMIDSSHRWEAVLRLVVQNTEVIASGVADDPKDAEVACSMHAEAILDALGLPVYTMSTRQAKHAAARRSEGKWAPMPGEAPRCVKRTVLPAALDYVGLDVIARKRLLGTAASTVDYNGDSHINYVEVEIIDYTSMKKLTKLHLDMGWGDFDPKDHVTVDCKMDIIYGKSFTAAYRLPLKGYGHRVGIGMASTPKDATALCCMHALSILSMLNSAEKVSADTPSPPGLCQISERQARRYSPQEEVRTIPIAPPTANGHESSMALTEWATNTTDGYLVVTIPATQVCDHTLINPKEYDVHSKDRLTKFLRYGHGSTSGKDNIFSAFPTRKILLVDPQNPSSNFFVFYRAAGYLMLPGVGKVKAIGEGPNIEDAICLACMHAELIIDHVGVHLFKERELQEKHALLARKCQRWAPLPTEGVRLWAKDNLPPPLRRKTIQFSVEKFSTLLAKEEVAEDEFLYTMVTLDMYYENDRIAYEQFLNRSGKGLWGGWQVWDTMKVAPEHRSSGRGDAKGLWKSTMRVPVPKEYGEREAMGFAQTPEDSQKMCLIHATHIIDTLALQLYDDSHQQSLHRKRANTEGRLAPTPTQKPHPNSKVPSPPPVRLRILGTMEPPVAPPRPVTMDQWLAYVGEAERYMQDQKCARDLEYLKQGRIPPTGVRVVDQATQAVEAEQHVPGMKTVLLRYCQDTGNEMPGHNNIVCEQLKEAPYFHAYFPVPGYETDFTAHGLSKDQPFALKKAYHHCVNILKLVDRQFLDTYKITYDTRSHIASQNWDNKQGDLTTTGRRNLLTLYARLVGSTRPKIVTQEVTNQEHVHTGARMFRSTVSITDRNGINVEAHGVYGSEHGALTEASIELIRVLMQHRERTLCDVGSLIGLLQKYPSLDVNMIPCLDAIFSENINLRGKLLQLVEDFDDGESASTKVTKEALQSMWNTKDRKVPFFDESMLPQKPSASRATLPILAIKDSLIASIRAHQVVVVCSATGSGKTTQIPQFILDDALEQKEACSIAITQPRRISAVSVAKRVSQERGEPKIGQSVGYRVRLDSHPGTHLTFLTGKLLLRILRTDPLLSQYTHIVLDEVHERDSSTDLLLMMLKEKILPQRPTLKLIVMSATMQSDLFAGYFGKHTPVLVCEKGVHEVTLYHLEDIATLAKAKSFVSPSLTNLSTPLELTNPLMQINGLCKAKAGIDNKLLSFVIDHVIATHEGVVNGCVLVFLPGWAELVMASDALSHLRNRAEILVLHSSVSSEGQMAAFSPPPEGKVKIVLSTNVCESSITIPDVRVVVDCGRLKEKVVIGEFTEASQLTQMHASKANCIQRTGRAGRTSRGACYRLFTKEHFDRLPEYQTPEITRMPLEEPILTLLSYGIEDPATFLRTNALDSPPEARIVSALKRLKDVGAIDSQGALTPLGLYMTPLPLDPHVARMVLLSLSLGCLDTALTVAACITTQPFKTSYDIREDVAVSIDILSNKSRSDTIGYINAYNGWIASRRVSEEAEELFLRDNILVRKRLIEMSQIKHQVYGVLMDAGYITDPNMSEEAKNRDYFVEESTHSRFATDTVLVKALLTALFCPNIAVENPLQRNYFIPPGDRTASLEASSVISTANSNEFALKSQRRTLGSKEGTMENGEANEEEGTLRNSPYYIYKECQKQSAGITGTHFRMIETTNVGIWSIVLLGTAVANMALTKGTSLLCVDHWLFVEVAPDTLELIKRLKYALQITLTKHLQDPTNEEMRRLMQRLQRGYLALLKCADTQMRPYLSEKGVILTTTESPSEQLQDYERPTVRPGKEGEGPHTTSLALESSAE